MPSPFPGMDPYLERPGLFPDFHDGFLAELRAQLNMVLPAPFYSALSGRVWMEQPGLSRQVVPDIQITRGPGPYRPRTESAGVAVAELAEPAVADFVELEVRWETTELRENTVEVYDGSHRLVASVELLSPANKFGEARGLYRDKQRQLRDSGVHTLEIDLLRTGPPATLIPASVLLAQQPFDYHLCLTRADRPHRSSLARLSLRASLPVVQLPLTPGLPEVPINLQAIFTRTYDTALYARRIDYSVPCDPPLAPHHAAWADTLLGPLKNPT